MFELSIGYGDTVVQQTKSRDQSRIPLRAYRRFVLALLWVALAACVVGSLAFDIADWLDVGAEMLTGVAAI